MQKGEGTIRTMTYKDRSIDNDIYTDAYIDSQ
jgi:hypothetical protein